MDGLIAYALAKKYTDEHGGGGNTGTVSFSGSGAPVSSIVAKEGDIYRDIDTDRLYICSQYIDPLHITNLKGLTITLPLTMPLPTNGFDDVSYQFGGQYSPTFKVEEYNINGDVGRSTNHYAMVVTATDSKIVTKTWSYGAWDRILFSESQTNLYDLSSAIYVKVIFYFPDNVDVTNEKLIRWFIDNALNIDGAGSIWKEVYALPDGLPDGNYNKAILQWDSSAGKWVPVSSPLDFYSSGSSNSMIRLSPGSTIEIWSGGNQATRLLTDDLTFRRGSRTISTHREMFNLLGGYKDSGVSSITNNTDLQTAQFCRPGNYGYINDTVAATLTNCPSNTSFSFKVITMSKSDYDDSSNYPTWSYNLRILIKWDGTIFLQNVYYENSGNWYFGPWNRVTTSAEVPDAPTTDGNYVLKCSVSDGTPTYTWVEET